MTPLLPLHDQKVLIPRGKKQAKAFTDLVESYGGIPVEIPLIAFRPIKISDELTSTLDSLHTYDWIIFTSNVTVETFFSFLPNAAKLEGIRIAVIGEKTKESLLRRDIQVHFKPQEYFAEGFVTEFLPLIEKGEKVLIPKGNLARDLISTSLRKKDTFVDELIIYETYFPQDSRLKLVSMLKNKDLNVLTFTSPSTVEHFMQVVNDHNLHDSIAQCTVACIGPITKKKAEDLGLQVDTMPTTYTVHEMLKSLIRKIKME